jgi:predicted neutral ceramidase superfamily lipid hydrolase
MISGIGGLVASISDEGMNPLTGLTLGLLGVALPLIVADLVTIPLLNGEPIMNPRRFTILTFVASIIYTFSILLSTMIGVPPLMDDRLMAGFLIASGITTFLRLLSLRVFVEGKLGRFYLAGLLQPSLCLVGAFIFLNRGLGSIWLMGALLLVNAVGVEALLWVIGLWREVEGIRLLPLFRAFILSWAEVMASDIHTVNGIGATREGYSPVGARMEWGRIVEYIVEAAEEDASNLQLAGVVAYRKVVPELMVLGEGGLDTLRRIMESGFSLFVRAALFIGVACFLTSVAIAYFFGVPQSI